MRFACSKCGRPEEVIGDDAPLCRYCQEPMIKATDSYKGLLMSPKFVIDRMEKIVGTYGTQEALTNGRLKKEREAYASAVWSLGLSEVDGHEHWIEIETIDQTPDTKTHYFDQSAGYNHGKIYNVEVVDWEPHIDDPMQVIRQKCARAYPPYFILLVFGRSGIEKVVQARNLLEAVRHLKVPFGEIWIIGRVSDSGYRMVKLHPNEFWIDVDIRRALKKDTRTKDFIKYEARGKSMEFRDLGQVYLPIPSIR